MEKKALQINEEGARRLVKFFDLLGFDTYAKELSHAWEEYEKKLNAVLYLNHKTANNIDEHFALIKGCLAEYENAYHEVKKAFGYFVSKTAIMTDEAKWRRTLI